MKRARWSNGKRTVTGSWRYCRASERFVITLDSRDPVTGDFRTIITANDTPEWDHWKKEA